MVRRNTARARIACCSSGGSYIGFIATDSAQAAVVDSVAAGSYGAFVVGTRQNNTVRGNTYDVSFNVVTFGAQ